MKRAKQEPQRFSEYFGLSSDNDFPFLDIYANQDIPLFLDPYGISAMGSNWSKECESNIATYFQYLIDSIKTGDRKTVRLLLNALHEVDEVSLGYSSSAPSGRGIGPKQALEIQAAFENSRAAKSGDIKDIADCALLIPGINRDKISDITANILKKKLIEYTQKQCRSYDIRMKKVPISNVFDYSTFTFTSYYDELPVINNRPKILLPKASVRLKPELSKDKYYRNFVLEFLKAEHEHAGDALASVLKNGRVVVRIADLKAKYPLKTDFLYAFSKENPQILERYKSELRRTANKKTTPHLETKRKVLSANDRMRIVADIRPGIEEATDFHKISFDNLIYIFGDRFANPNREREINDGRKRVDIVFDNSGSKGFFHQLNTLYHIQCPKILIECKNYGREIGNPEIDQLAGRFNSKRGHFGILICRSVADKQSLMLRCKDVMHDNKGYILVFDDDDINSLLTLKGNDDEQAIDSYLSNKFDELIM